MNMTLRTVSAATVIVACGRHKGAAPVVIEAAPVSEPEPTASESEPPVQAVAPAVAGPERSPFEVRLDAFAGWLSGHAEVDVVASWGRRARTGWVRDRAGLSVCMDGHCWREAARPELVTLLVQSDGWSVSGATMLAWGPAGGEIEAWEFDPETMRKRRLGTLTARAREPRPLWWTDRAIELVVPGKAYTMSVTSPPDFPLIGLTPRGKPGEWEAWSTIAAPDWLEQTDGLVIWPFRSQGGAVALWVTAEERIGVCARLGRWRCAPLERPARPTDSRAPVRAEVVGAAAIAVEFAEAEDSHDAEWRSSGRAELHVLAVEGEKLVDVGAWTNGGIVGTYELLGMYRSMVDLDYRFVERAYQPWEAAGECVRFAALVAEEQATDLDFGRLGDLLVKQWRVRGDGKLPKPREPRALSQAAGRKLIAEAAVLEKNRLAEPGEELLGGWKVAGGKVARARECGR